MLIKRGANVSAVDPNLNTPLHLVNMKIRMDDDADGTKAFAIAELLVNNGADLNAKNSNEKTPLDLAKNDKSKLMSRNFTIDNFF